MALLPGIKLPLDVKPSGAGTRDWIDITLYGETRNEVITKKDNYLREYPPQGYDTRTVGSIGKHPDGYYYIFMRRWSSCS